LGKGWENILQAMRNTALPGTLVFALVLFANLLGAAQPARASEVTISVLGLEPAAGAPEAVATSITEAIRQRVTSTSGYRLVPGRDLVEVKLVFSCPDEAPPCMSQAAQSIGATKVIFGNLQPVGTDAYLVTLKLLDADKGVVEGWISEQITKAQTAPMAVRGPAQKWFAALTGQTAPGNLKITGGVVGANVWLDGAQAGILGADGLTLAGVAGGSHDVTVSKTGYAKFERKVTVASGATEKLVVELKAAEGPGEGEQAAAPADETAGRVSTPEVPEPAEPPGQGARVAAWALLGLGLVGIGVGGYSTYEVGVVNSNLDPYRLYPCTPGSAPTCGADGKPKSSSDLDKIRSPAGQAYISQQQKTGDGYTTLQWVGYGLGGALVATSAVFFYRGYFAHPSASGSNDHRGNLIVMPSFSPNSAGALAYMAF
jgi:hypothetical protein